MLMVRGEFANSLQAILIGLPSPPFQSLVEAGLWVKILEGGVQNSAARLMADGTCSRAGQR